MTLRSRVAGTGMCVPDRVVTNADLTQWMDTTEEWIEQRTGIRERRWVEEGQRPSDLAREATRAALEQAELETSEIDCILLATLSGEHDFPGTSFFLHEAIDAGDIPCIDLRAQCSGFLYALQMGDALISAGRYRRVLVVGCEVHSTGLDISTAGRDVTVIFGDGAGAVVLEACEADAGPGLLEIRLHAEGKHARRLWLEAPGCALPGRITHEMLDERRAYPYMDGRFVFKHAVTRMPEVLLETLHAASLKVDDVDLFLFHQANLRINEFVAQKLEIPESKVLNNIQRYGNCSAAALPILLAEASREGRLEPGQLVSLTAFGSGFTWGSAVLRWG
ncbi:MAG: ketoacyl-ACP synthase III [Deltaproteobacteria bacterium]|nr:ketoacyl-ACP synthase III [Deltaproteobacteria bacterium]MBW2499154.1 ketoacyl-ACP synthase III [Deltaproteobacteria bacterium]